MRALFRKELEELVGLLVLVVFALLVVGWAHTTVQLPVRNGEEVVRYLLEDIVVTACLGAFAAGHSRFGPEYQQGTIAFLDGLPTSRSRIFAVKLVAGAIPVVAFSVGTALIKLVALQAHPLPNAASAVAVAALVGLSVLLIVAAHYATGLVLSWFGEVGWQALLVTGGSLILVTQLLPGASPWYPLFDGAVKLTITQGVPTIPWGPAVFWALWTVVGVALSWVLFLGPGDRIATGPWWVKGLAQVMVYTPPAMTLLLLIVGSMLISAIELPSLVRSTWRADTEHFRFLATVEERDAAERLIARAEEVRGLVEARFGAPGPEHLDVELTGASDHLGGVFAHGKLQLRPDADAGTLAHELSHAWSHGLGAPDDEPSWRFFEEGLASFNQGVVEVADSQAAIPALGSPASDWFLAPVHGRRQERFNPDEDYAVGRAWAAAIVEVGGPKAPTCVIRAAGARPRGEVDSVPWWSLLLADCGMSIDAVIAAYENGLPRSPPFPEMIAWYAETSGGAHRIRFTPPPAEAEHVVCMARPDASAPRTMYALALARPDAGECALGAFSLSARGFDLAVGWSGADGDHHLGEWRRVGDGR